eukprot:58809-Hanusia_phi.AAC.1
MESSAYPTPGRTITHGQVIIRGDSDRVKSQGQTLANLGRRSQASTSAIRRHLRTGSSTTHAQEWATPGISMCTGMHTVPDGRIIEERGVQIGQFMFQ